MTRVQPPLPEKQVINGLTLNVCLHWQTLVVHVLHVQWGGSPLWSASFNDHLKCVELLIDAGAQVDVQKEVSVSSCAHLSHTASPGDQFCNVTCGLS